MKTGLFFYRENRRPWIPEGVLCPRFPQEAAGMDWDLLALTEDGCARLGERSVCGRILLAPGSWHGNITGESIVISCGLSPRDSLTLSGLRQPVLCVQRAVPDLRGGWIEPQEFPLPDLPDAAEKLLPLLGLRLLLTGSPWLREDERERDGKRQKPLTNSGKRI